MTAVGRPLELQELEPREPGAGEVLVRVRAAGICHSDAHYRSGLSPMGPLPLTLGHEIAGVVERVGPGVASPAPGDRVGIHYLHACGRCPRCIAGQENHCPSSDMFGHHRDGGFAEAVTVPARNVVPLPAGIPFEHAAVMMCSSATALHALRKGRLQPGDDVAIFGFGGLGVSALQLARAMGAARIWVVDIRAERLELARHLGGIPIDASVENSEKRLLDHGQEVQVALDLVGLPGELDPYREILGRERELIGSNDHTLAELTELVDFVERGALDLSHAVTGRVPLEAGAINGVLDALEQNRAGVRTVVVP